MKKYLFICSANRDRSLTAEVIFTPLGGIECISCGTNKDAPTIVSPDLLEWADTIFVMENKHKRKIMNQFHDRVKAKKIVTLAIPDKYFYMDEELVKILKKKMSVYI